jgi:hypothetical protein
MITTDAPRNIHIIAEDEGRGSKAEGARLREVTNAPLREYAARPGCVEPLPDSVAALILSRKGRCIVERGQIKATIDGVERDYASRESLVIAEMDGTGRKVLWFANRRKPDCIHLCTNQGVYIETIPLKSEAAWFAQDAASREAHATAVSHRQAQARRLAEIHAPDIAAAAARERHNADELEKKVREDERIVRSFPAEGRGPKVEGTEGPAFARADAGVAAMAGADDRRERHAEQVVSEERRRSTALSLGQALREQVFANAESSPVLDDES